MDNIRIISAQRDLAAYVADLRARGVGAIALDLEADQGSYRYRYSICIFQCFDGRDAVIIDVLALGSALGGLRDLLEAPDIVKVMFSAKNDLFITQNVLDCGISPISDIAVAQKLLGLPVNLSAHLGIDKVKKDGFQRANWLIRPITKELLAYAAGDVELLLGLEADLRAQMDERRLLDRYREACAALPRTDYRIDQYRQYENKFPGWERLGPGQRDLARLIWIFRELVGEHYDCPVGYILSTKILPELLGGGPEGLESRLETALNRGRRAEKRIGGAFVREKMEKARKAIAAGLQAPSMRMDS